MYEYIYTHIYIPKYNLPSLYNTSHMYVFMADHLVLGASKCALPEEERKEVSLSLSLSLSPPSSLALSAFLTYLSFFVSAMHFACLLLLPLSAHVQAIMLVSEACSFNLTGRHNPTGRKLLQSFCPIFYNVS